MRYRVHRFSIKMSSDEQKLEQFLNSLEGDVVAIIPNVTWAPKTHVDSLLIVEKLSQSRSVIDQSDPIKQREDEGERHTSRTGTLIGASAY